MGQLLVRADRVLPGAGEPALVTCICKSLLQSSCRACSLPPSCPWTRWAETRGSARPSHATLLRGGDRTQDEVRGLFLHLSIPRASLEAGLEGKDPYCEGEESPGRGALQASMAEAQEGRAGAGPGAPQEACCPARTPTPLRPGSAKTLLRSVVHSWLWPSLAQTTCRTCQISEFAAAGILHPLKILKVMLQVQPSSSQTHKYSL